jgi:hypothetical protein
VALAGGAHLAAAREQGAKVFDGAGEDRLHRRIRSGGGIKFKSVAAGEAGAAFPAGRGCGHSDVRRRMQ